MDNKLNNVNAVLTRFRDFVISEAKKNLNKGGQHGSHNNTNSLKDSLKGEIVKEDDYSIVGFSMAYYGQFVDKGVQGKSSSSKAPKSPYKFGKGKGNGGLTNGILKWVQQKRFQFRVRKGIDNGKAGTLLSYKQTAYLISRSIFHKGIKPSLFFTKPFEAGYKKYIDTDLMKAFGQDIDTMVDYNLNDIK